MLTMIQPLESLQCIWGKSETFWISYNLKWFSYSNIPQPSFRHWKRVVNWTLFFLASMALHFLTYWRTEVGRLAVKKTKFFFMFPTLIVIFEGILYWQHHVNLLTDVRVGCALELVKYSMATWSPTQTNTSKLSCSQCCLPLLYKRLL